MSIIRDNIEDLRVIDTNTSSIADIKESSLSKVASNVLMSGNLALASSAVTKSNANITYTGNGSTQSITTGIGSVDFTVASNGSGYYHDRAAGDCIVKNDAGTIVESGSAVVNVSKVHIKSRSLVSGNEVFDGLRGVFKILYTNLTNAEDSSTETLTVFTPTGFTVGSNDWVNENLATYIAHQTLYTHIKWGLTSQGKRYLTAYNPVTREVMTMYQGSGIAGHQIPNPLGIKLDYVERKQLDGTGEWLVNTKDIDGLNYLLLNSTTAQSVSSGTYANITDDYIEVGTTSSYTNGANNSYISYGFANSETKIITQYQGTGVAGNFVETKDVNGVAKKPRRVIIKRIDSIGHWTVLDTARDDFYLFLSDSLEEASSNTIDYNINGFTVISTGTGVNASGGQYLYLVEFDTNGDGGDSYFDLPTDDTNLNVTAGKLPYTDGRDTTNGAYNVFTQSYTGSVDFSTCPDGIHYVALDSNNAPKFYEKVAIGSYEKEAADDNRLVFNTEDGKWYTTTGGELVTNGTFDTDVSGWTNSNVNATVENGRLKMVDNGSDSQMYQYLTTIAGQKYKVELQFEVSGAGDGYVDIRKDTNGGAQLVTSGFYSSGTNVLINMEFVAESSTSVIRLKPPSTTGNIAYADNISVYKKEATLDTALTTPISFIDDKPYQVASGTPMDRLVDYPSIPKNVMESSYVDGDLEVSGEVKGKNQCTGWVNFDGTTTPPTIRDSYNVSDVVRISAGVYDVYFETDMVNTNYSFSSQSGLNAASNPAQNPIVYKAISYFQVEHRESNNTRYNVDEMSVQIFGGK